MSRKRERKRGKEPKRRGVGTDRKGRRGRGREEKEETGTALRTYSGSV